MLVHALRASYAFVPSFGETHCVNDYCKWLSNKLFFFPDHSLPWFTHSSAARHFNAPLRPRIAGQTWLLGAGTGLCAKLKRAFSPALRLRCSMQSSMRIVFRMEVRMRQCDHPPRNSPVSILYTTATTNNKKTHVHRCQFKSRPPLS